MNGRPFRLECGDALELLPTLPAGSVDLVLVDLPYGTTRASWDKKLPVAPMWEEVKRVRKKNAACLFFGAQPFTTLLNASNLREYRYDLVWEKTRATGHLNAKRMPMRAHEHISVFYAALPTYNPLKTSGHALKKTRSDRSHAGTLWGPEGPRAAYESTERFPRSVLQFKSAKRAKDTHPTAKPVPLLEWLIETYSNPGDTVLDFCAGSGSTGVAALACGRTPILFEKEAGWVDVARRRCEGGSTSAD